MENFSKEEIAIIVESVRNDENLNIIGCHEDFDIWMYYYCITGYLEGRYFSVTLAKRYDGLHVFDVSRCVTENIDFLVEYFDTYHGLTLRIDG